MNLFNSRKTEKNAHSCEKVCQIQYSKHIQRAAEGSQVKWSYATDASSKTTTCFRGASESTSHDDVTEEFE